MPKVDIIKMQKIVDRAWDLRLSLLHNSMYGKYKTYKENLQEHTAYTVKNFDVLKILPFPAIDGVSRFSREGINMQKIKFLEFFRFRTKEEKLLRKMFREDRVYQIINEVIPDPKNQFNPLTIKNTDLSKKVLFNLLTGNHKAYVASLQEYASFIVKNPDMANHSVFERVRVPVLSKEGLAMLKVSLLDKFRIKSKDEKLMREIVKNAQENNPAFRVFH